MSVTADKPLLSVITVCFNAAALLPRTMASVHAQRWPAREWVVVDGASTDGTQSLVQGSPQLPAAFISEPDRGIYDAMNKGIALARGEVLYFLNADDRLHDPDVLTDVANCFAADASLNFLIANVVVEKPGMTELHTQDYINRFTLPFTDPCHQGVFVRRRLFDEVGLFDLRWPTSADYDWFMRVRQAGHRIQHLDRTVAFFPAGGAHAANPVALANERRALRAQYMPAVSLAVGAFAARAANRLSRMARRGNPIGHTRLAGS